MNRIHLEAKVLSLVGQVLAGAMIEDDTFELKARWPDPKKAARRIAGMANAAAGAQIHWLIGIDEDAHAVRPLDENEVSNWWAQVQARFADSVTPSIQVLTVVTESGPVVCLSFETDRAPYLVKPDGQSAIASEVPWRSATAVRTATRAELISLLLPHSRVPTLEVIDSGVSFSPVARDGCEGFELGVVQTIFIDHPYENVVLPRHKWSLNFSFGDDAGGFATYLMFDGGDTAPYGVSVRDVGLVVTGPGVVRMRGGIVLRNDEDESNEWARSVLAQPTIDSELRLPVAGTSRLASSTVRHWQLPDYEEPNEELVAEWVS
ncbi:hypothetical protein ACWFPY_17195 [Nocardia fluminea]